MFILSRPFKSIGNLRCSIAGKGIIQSQITSCSKRDHSVCRASTNSILKIPGCRQCSLSVAKGVVGLHSAGEVWYLRLPCYHTMTPNCHWHTLNPSVCQNTGLLQHSTLGSGHCHLSMHMFTWHRCKKYIYRSLANTCKENRHGVSRLHIKSLSPDLNSIVTIKIYAWKENFLPKMKRKDDCRWLWVNFSNDITCIPFNKNITGSTSVTIWYTFRWGMLHSTMLNSHKAHTVPYKHIAQNKLLKNNDKPNKSQTYEPLLLMASAQLLANHEDQSSH